MSNKISTARGTKDLYAESIKKFNNIVEIAKSEANSYGFDEISTPIFEFSEVFERNLGDDSDIVSKEIYKFTDKSDNSITLRPEFTAGVVRSFAENGYLNQKLPQKLFSYGALFRYERPQKGRQRQFHQVNFEYFGGQSHFVDFEIIALAYDFLKKLDLQNCSKLKINSLGSAEVKQKYQEYLVEYFSKYQSDLSSDSQQRLIKNPLRILDSKNQKDIEISFNLKEIKEFYSQEESDRFEKIQKLLIDFKIPFEVDYKLVRGLDYYSSTVFEFISDQIGAKDTILAGGRYDNLVEKMAGTATPAIGFAAGIERLMILSSEITNKEESVAVIFISENEKLPALKIVQQLRYFGIRTEIYLDQNFKKQMKFASRDQHKLVLIIGEEEVRDNTITVKNFKSGETSCVANSEQSFSKIKNILKKSII
jgi:histidyl-tRNA synthetase